MELKPCPFCGGKAEVYSDYNSTTDRIYGVAKCTECGVRRYGGVGLSIREALRTRKSMDEWIPMAHETAQLRAAEKWNKRSYEKQVE